ncbi:MAG: metallophosphoesterase [Siculibacillus sp.]
MITRRRLLQTLAAGGAGMLSLGGYAVAIEPHHRLSIARYDLELPRWPVGAKPLTAALIADLHAGDPWMSVERIEEIVAATNAVGADIVLMLGDYVGTHRFRSSQMDPRVWARPFADLKSPLGTWAILGNHDYWWEGGPEPVIRALRTSGIEVLLNRGVKIDRDGHRFWLAGTESTLVHRMGEGRFVGRADVDAAHAAIDDDAPILHLAHEPAFIRSMPRRVALTLSGHTLGGQVKVPFFGPPLAASHPDLKWARGHYVEDGRHLLVSSGLGCSILPVRFMVPPEITVARITSPAIA